jgi:hypothetical protein
MLRDRFINSEKRYKLISTSTGEDMQQLSLRGSKLAYYLKKRCPELYQRAREIRERYGVTWDKAIAIARGELPEPQQSASIDAMVRDVEELKKDVAFIKSKLEDIEKKLKCIYIDSEGYCTARALPKTAEGLELKEVDTPNGKKYLVNVEKHRLICAICTLYKPRGDYILAELKK